MNNILIKPTVKTPPKTPNTPTTYGYIIAKLITIGTTNSITAPSRGWLGV